MGIHTPYTTVLIIQYKCWFLLGFSCILLHRNSSFYFSSTNHWLLPLSLTHSSAFTFIHSIFLILSLVSKVWETHHLTSWWWWWCYYCSSRLQPNLYTYIHTHILHYSSSSSCYATHLVDPPTTTTQQYTTMYV